MDADRAISRLGQALAAANAKVDAEPTRDEVIAELDHIIMLGREVLAALGAIRVESINNGSGYVVYAGSVELGRMTGGPFVETK